MTKFVESIEGEKKTVIHLEFCDGRATIIATNSKGDAQRIGYLSTRGVLRLASLNPVTAAGLGLDIDGSYINVEYI